MKTAEIETAVEGETGILRCTFSHQKPADLTVVVLWQKIDPKTRKSTVIFNSLVSKGGIDFLALVLAKSILD